MKHNSSFFMVGAAIALSSLIVASVFFGGFGNGLRPTANAAMMDNNTTASGKGGSMMNADNMMMPQTGYHVIKGQISNVQVDTAGKPAWIESGIWVLRVTFGNNTVDTAQLIARISMVKPD